MKRSAIAPVSEGLPVAYPALGPGLDDRNAARLLATKSYPRDIGLCRSSVLSSVAGGVANAGDVVHHGHLHADADHRREYSSIGPAQGSDGDRNREFKNNYSRR